MQAFVTGYTSSTNFPIISDAQQSDYGGGAYDAFVSTLSADGSSLLHSTYLGGSGNDQAKGIAVDTSGAAYVIGDTDSTNFPIKAPGNAFQRNLAGNRDAFVAKLDANSADLDYSTYLGGTSQEVAYGIAVDAAGEAYAMRTTPSPNFPVTTATAFQPTLVGAVNDFVTKLDASGHNWFTQPMWVVGVRGPAAPLQWTAPGRRRRRNHG
jgi:hypothetical protein